MTNASREPDSSLVTVTHITYALHALGLAIGAFGAASVLGSFLFGWPSIIAVIINYVKRGDARGTWLESHFTWQIRTFWWALLWMAVAFLLSLPLMLVLVGFATLWLGAMIVGAWVLYRVVRGWVRLSARVPMYA